MTAILAAFDSSSSALSLTQLTERTNLPRSSLYRIVENMTRLRWLDRTPAGYQLGLRPLELGTLAMEHHELRKRVRPQLETLARRTGLVAHLTLLDRSDIVFIDRIGCSSSSTVVSRVGSRLPAHATASGKAMLACLHESALAARLGTVLARRTVNTVGHIDQLVDELSRVRSRRGLAFDRGEAAVDIGCVGLSLHVEESHAAAVSLSGDLRTLNMHRAAQTLIETVVDLNVELAGKRRFAQQRRAPHPSTG